jgi:hypothetical protein
VAYSGLKWIVIISHPRCAEALATTGASSIRGSALQRKNRQEFRVVVDPSSISRVGLKTCLLLSRAARPCCSPDVDRNRVRKYGQCVLHFYDTSKKET